MQILKVKQFGYYVLREDRNLNGGSKKYTLRDILTISGDQIQSQATGNSKQSDQAGLYAYIWNNSRTFSEAQVFTWLNLAYLKEDINDVNENLENYEMKGGDSGDIWAEICNNYHPKLKEDRVFKSAQEIRDKYDEFQRKAKQQINSLQEIKDNTDKNKVKATTMKQDNKEYIKVGPFKWSIPELSSITIKGKKNYNDNDLAEVQEVEFAVLNGTNYSLVSVSDLDDYANNGKDIYILIPDSQKFTSINEITLKSKSIESMTAEVYLFESPRYNDAWQNLIFVNPSKELINKSETFTYNIPLIGDLPVIKVNLQNEQVALPNVGFKLKNETTGKYIAYRNNVENSENMYEVDDIKSAYEYKTDANGKHTVKGLIVGSYSVYETKNPNYGYFKNQEELGDGKLIEEHIQVTAGDATDKTPIPIDNPQRFVKLSGYVWVDRIDPTKGQARNDFYAGSDIDINDTLLDGIAVKLMKGNEVVDTTTTSNLGRYKDSVNNGHGEYLFTDVKIEELENYHIEFVYDGITYTNVIPHIDANNGSKAAESEEVRRQFNLQYSSVEPVTEEVLKQIGLTDYQQGKDTQLILGDINLNGSIDAQDVLMIQTYIVNLRELTSFQKLIADVNKDGSITSVDSLTLLKMFNGIQEQEIIHFNLIGITRDEQGNVGNILLYNKNGGTTNLVKAFGNLINATTDVTQYKIKDHFTYGEEEVKYINLGLYEREKADMAILKDMHNVRLTVNGYEHTYFYGQRFKKVVEYDGGFNVGVQYKNEYTGSYTRPIYQSDYKYENPNEQSKELKMYVTYQIAISNQSSNLRTKINSIVDYYDSNYQFASAGTSVDEAGNPNGNIKPTEEDYNNSYKKLTIPVGDHLMVRAQNKAEEASIYVQFELDRQAVIKVLNGGENLDNVAEINSYTVYNKEGNGIFAAIDVDSAPGDVIPENTADYEDDTDTAPAFKVELTDARELEGKVFLDATSPDLMTGEIRQGTGKYEEGEAGIEGVKVTLTETSGSGKVYEATTNRDGDFLITGFIPGDYTLTYTWGDETYTVQNYKGTIYDNTRDQGKDWYKKDVNTRFTDAIDNYDEDQEAPKGSRLQIDAEMGSNITRTKMDSTTPLMGIGVEYETTYTASSGDKYTYRISNVDFGIVERARQELDISKRVTGVTITLANGQVLIDATVNEDGTLSGTKGGLTYMGPSDGNLNGTLKAEIDNELIQGATVQITYKVNVNNNSELDYDSENYYKYGIVEGNVITLTPKGVYDYLDSQMVLDTNKDNGEWEVISREGYNATYPEETTLTLIEQYYKQWSEAQTGEDGTLTEKSGWERLERYETLLEEWQLEVIEGRTIRDTKLDNKTILHNANLEEPLVPGDSHEVDLYTSKVLANTDEIDLNNDAEITEITRTSETGRIPGYSEIYDSGEEVTVTPPTGDNQNYILPITVGMIALIILGTGVVIIKKKVLDQ